MKNISFKRKEPLIRGLEIQMESKTKKPRNWDRIIYFILLFVILFFLLRYVINTFFYVRADGQVLFDKVDIRNTNDCRIVDFFVERGDSVEVGDSLFSFIPDKPDGSFNEFGTYEFAMEQKKGADVSWAEKEIFKKKEDAKLNSYLIKEKEVLKSAYQKELERIRNEVTLDVLPRNSLDNQLAKISELNYEIETLKGENALLLASLSQLSKMVRNLGNNGSAGINGNKNGLGNNGANGSGHIFFSPLKGTVTNILKNNYEVALKEEVVLSIHRPSNVYIRAFFNQEDLKYVAINDVVELEFPDGTIGKGIIKRFYFATYQLPEEFQKKYEPTTRALSADVYPIDADDLLKWKTFWKLGIVITKYKY